MMKSLLLASAISLLVSSPVMAETATAPALASCAACAAPADPALQDEPRRPRQVAEAVAMPSRGPIKGGDGGPSICCDPAMFIPVAQFQSMFKDDPTGGNVTSNFGFTFSPTPAFTSSVNNTAFIANTLLGLPFSHFIIRAEMRTDDQPHGSFVPGTLDTTWNTFGRVVRGWNQNFYVEDSNLGYVMAANANPFTAALNAPTDMVRDGRRYIVKFTYWVAYMDPRTREWVARQVVCNNVPNRYIGISKDTVGMKVGAGNSTGPVIMAEDVAPAQQASTMSFGKPVPLRPEEVQMLRLKK